MPPFKPGRKIPYAYDKALYRQRRRAENLFAKLKLAPRRNMLRQVRPHLLLDNLRCICSHLPALVHET